MAVAVVPAALQAAIAGYVEHQIDSNAGRHHCADQGRTVAGQVFGETALHIAIQRDAHVVAGVGERTLEVE